MYALLLILLLLLLLLLLLVVVVVVTEHKIVTACHSTAAARTHTHTQGRDTFPFDTPASGFELVVVASISTSRVDDAIEDN